MSTEVIAENCASPPVWERTAIQTSRSDFLGNVFACVIPMLMFMEVRLVGRLFLSEILLLPMLPFLIVTRGRKLLTPLPRGLLLLGLAWLLAQILTDFIRGTPFEDWSRGWSKIIFLLLNFSAIYLYLNNIDKRFFLFATGIALGQILIYFLNPHTFSEYYPWKFGYGLAITLLAVLTSQTKVFSRWKFLPATIILAMGVLNLYMGFRSLGLICILAGGYVFVKQSNIFGLAKMKQSKLVLFVFLGGITIYGIYAFYGFAATEGWFGNDARTKYLQQSSGDFGVLLGGRSEILASLQAVMDSPIIGHGSWAKDWTYVDIRRAALIEHGYPDPGELGSGLIPSHSYIMGAWVESGIVGAIFWFWALILVIRTLNAALSVRLNLTPLIAFVGFNLLWNIPFSPFGAEGRLYVAYFLVLIIYTLRISGSSPVTKGLA